LIPDPVQLEHTARMSAPFIEFKSMNSRLHKALLEYASHPKFNFIRVVEFGPSDFGAEEYDASSIEAYKEHINSIAEDMKLPFKGADNPKLQVKGSPSRQIHSVKIGFCDYYNGVPILEEHAVAICAKIKQLL